jgi:hypothetical protein
MSKDWIENADLHKGAFTAWAKRQGFSGATDKAVAAGKKSKNSKIEKEANLAATFKEMKK